MVLLNMLTNSNSTIIANFESLYDETYINFQNNKSCIFAAGILNNSFKIYDKNNLTDFGLFYDNNTLSTRNINAQSFKYNDYTVFPNNYTNIIDYKIIAIPGYNLINSPFDCFTTDTTTYWQSRQIYSRTSEPATNGTVLLDKDYYKFKDKQVYGEHIIITFPYKVIPIGFTVNSIGNKHDPKSITVFLSNDGINWDKQFEGLVSTEINKLKNYDSSFNNFFTYIAVIITQINFDTYAATEYLTYFILNNLIIYTKSLLFLDNNIKICNDNIYNIKSINVKELYINDTNISSVGDIANSAIESAIDTIIAQNSFYWKTLSNVGYYDTSLINKLAVGQSNATAMLDIKEDICYNNKILKKFISVKLNQIYTQGDTIFSSSYIQIGQIDIYKNSNKFYFNLKFYSYDIGNVYYFQKINIFGNVYINYNSVNGLYSLSNIYWNTSYNNSSAIQRIVNIKYFYNSTVNSIIFYAEYNSELNLSRLSSLGIIPFENLIFFDEFHTNKETTTFLFPDLTISLSEQTGVQTNYLSEAILTSKKILNTNSIYTTSNIITNLFPNTVTLNSGSISKQNILMLDNNNNIADTYISSNIFAGLKIASYYNNSITGTDNRGILKSLQIPNNLLSNLNNIASSSTILPKIITTIPNNYGFETINFNKSNLDYLSSINSIINSIVVVDNNGILKTTNSLPYNNFSNIEETLKLFTFSNQREQDVSITSNIILNSLKTSNIYIGKTLITSNDNLKRVLINNQEIGQDIFKSISKFPSSTLKNFSQNTNVINPNYVSYYITYNNSETNIIDTNYTNYAGSTNNHITNLLSKDINNYWETSVNFRSDGTYLTAHFVYGKSTEYINTKCGAYFVINFDEPIVLTNYIFYVNTLTNKHTIKSFNVFGINDNDYDKIDYNIEITLKKFFIPNNFNIKKTNINKSYSKFAFCITEIHNNTQDSISCILGAVELFGYKVSNNNSNFTYNTLNNTVILGNSNIGIRNLNPSVALSIGPDIYYNYKQSLINLNHDYFSNGIESPIINITKSSLDTQSIGAIHYINNINTSNTNYTIKLTHNSYLNEKIVLSMNSDGKIGIGSNPILTHSNNGLSIFNNGLSLYENSNYINFQTNGITSNYSIVLPNSNGLINNVMSINSINGNKSFLVWKNPLDILYEQPYLKIGNNTTVATRNENNIALQVAGSCLIGSNVSEAILDTLYLRNNTLIVSGNIYSTSDIATDSDIAYKYNLELIKNPLEKITKLNGYIFNRNDTNDNEKYTGLIAQEVLKVMPEVIVKKHDGKLRVLYANLAGLFVEGLKKINEKCDYINTKTNICLFLISVLFYLNAKNGIFN